MRLDQFALATAVARFSRTRREPLTRPIAISAANRYASTISACDYYLLLSSPRSTFLRFRLVIHRLILAGRHDCIHLVLVTLSYRPLVIASSEVAALFEPVIPGPC